MWCASCAFVCCTDGLLWHLFNTSSDAQYQAAWGRPIALALNGMGCCVTAILLFKFLPNAMDPGCELAAHTHMLVNTPSPGP